MKQWGLAVLVVAGLAAVALTLRGRDRLPATPEAVVSAFFDAAERGDDAAYLRLTCGELLRSLGQSRTELGHRLDGNGPNAPAGDPMGDSGLRRPAGIIDRRSSARGCRLGPRARPLPSCRQEVKSDTRQPIERTTVATPARCRSRTGREWPGDDPRRNGVGKHR